MAVSPVRARLAWIFRIFIFPFFVVVLHVIWNSGEIFGWNMRYFWYSKITLSLSLYTGSLARVSNTKSHWDRNLCIYALSSAKHEPELHSITMVVDYYVPLL